MARVFKCDLCGRLENHDPKNRWLSAPTGFITKEHEDGQERMEACKQCMTDFDTWLKAQKKAE